MNFKTYRTTSTGEELMFRGNPSTKLLDELAEGAGDVWHSSLDQGFKNCLPELVYQTAVYWWFLNDFEDCDSCVNWRININAFVIRKSVWDEVKEISEDYEGPLVGGLDFGFNLLRNNGGIPLYIKGLFQEENSNVKISIYDRYLFFLRNFKKKHSYYMLLRKGLLNFPKEFAAFKRASKHKLEKSSYIVQPKVLQPIKGKPTISLVIPTMKRQAYTELLLQDHNAQSYLIKEAIIVDATPPEERDDKYYKQENFKFNVKVKWQTSKGSCRARNEAIDMCTGDYIIFADDDVRVLPDFVENHIRLLQTYNAEACNGLDIMAEHVNQDLDDLKRRLNDLGNNRWKVGVSHMFSNANSCVKKSLVDALVGNDINFDGGYGEDSDFGFRILKMGKTLLHNPYSPNLHLKPPVGGYRFWGNQAKILGKKRKSQPWELGEPVRFIRPVPSPTMTYKYIKHYKKKQLKEWRYRYFFMYLFGNKKSTFILRLFNWPLKKLQFKKSMYYAKRLMYRGPKYN
ncbi:glycosyltransferase family 2 protein [Winogradskyella ouciana]